MLLRENPRTQGLFGIVGIHGDGGLRNDWPMVGFFIDEMDRGPGNADSVLQRLTLGMGAGERRQERGVDIDNPLGKGADEKWGQYAHETRQDYEFNLIGAEALNERRLESFA